MEVDHIFICTTNKAPEGDLLGNLEIIPDGMSFIELEFDGLMANKSKDFRPELPLIIKW